jgi:serine/threonine protein kinase
MPGGSVADLLKKFGPFPLGQIKSYSLQILTGLEFLHKNEVIHRDIKGGNILVDEMGVVKLADFGASSRMQSGKTVDMTTIKGTPFFMAPEVLNSGK